MKTVVFSHGYGAGEEQEEFEFDDDVSNEEIEKSFSEWLYERSYAEWWEK